VPNKDFKLWEKWQVWFKNLGLADPAHDEKHVQRVWGLAHRIAHEEKLMLDMEILEAAILLHEWSEAHPKVEQVAKVMADLGFPPEKAEAVSACIHAHPFHRKLFPPTPEAAVLQDADRLDASGAIGVARCFAYGGAVGQSLEQCIDHFYSKLLKLKEGLHTEAARRLAEDRHAFLLTFLNQYRSEEEGANA
jgi:uncharacterized protein